MLACRLTHSRSRWMRRRCWPRSTVTSCPSSAALRCCATWTESTWPSQRVSSMRTWASRKPCTVSVQACSWHDAASALPAQHPTGCIMLVQSILLCSLSKQLPIFPWYQSGSTQSDRAFSSCGMPCTNNAYPQRVLSLFSVWPLHIRGKSVWGLPANYMFGDLILMRMQGSSSWVTRSFRCPATSSCCESARQRGSA